MESSPSIAVASTAASRSRTPPTSNGSWSTNARPESTAAWIASRRRPRPVRELLTRLAQRGANLGSATTRLLGLLEEFGAARLEQAIREALANDIPHHHAVRQILERQRRAEGRCPALPVELPDDPRLRELTIRPHSLEGYDQLTHDIVDPQESDDPGEPDTDNLDHQENKDHDE